MTLDPVTVHERNVCHYSNMKCLQYFCVFDWFALDSISVDTERLLPDGIEFGQTEPPLCDFIKSILDKYPVGGQILKVGYCVCNTKK